MATSPMSSSPRPKERPSDLASNVAAGKYSSATSYSGSKPNAYSGGGSGSTTGIDRNSSSDGGGGGGVFGFSGVRDMVDGGGPGAAGSTFQGGPTALALNTLGVRPLGSGPAVPTTQYRAPTQVYNGGGDGNNAFLGASPGAAAVPGVGKQPKVEEAMTTPPEVLLWLQRRSQFPSVAAWIGAAPQGVGDPTRFLSGSDISRWNRERSQVPEYKDGGMIGPMGIPKRPNTNSLDIPPQLAQMLGMPSYAEGGMIGPMGMPQRPNGAQPGLAQPGDQKLTPQQVEVQAQQFVQRNPQQVQEIQGAIQEAMATGELTQQELNMVVQMATVALQNPDMYPQLRQLAIQQGLAEEGDISPEFDSGLLFALVVAGKATANAAGGAMPMSQGQAPVASMKTGGQLPMSSPNPDGSIPINAHEGEYVIPAHVVRAKGTEFFDKLVMQYQKGKAGGGDNGGASDT